MTQSVHCSVDWDGLPTLGYVCQGIRYTNPVPGFCDREIFEREYHPDAISRETFDSILAPLRALVDVAGSWTCTSRTGILGNGCGSGPANVFQWRSSDGDRIELWQAHNGEAGGDGFIALETKDGRVLVAGCAGCHPYVMCNSFTFGNSDGSSDWEAMQEPVEGGEAINAADALRHLIAITEKYVWEQIH